jgi:hypothetical protein
VIDGNQELAAGLAAEQFSLTEPCCASFTPV